MESPPIFNRFWSFSQYSNFASVRKINILIDTTIWIHDTYAQFIAPLKRKRGRKKMLLKKKKKGNGSDSIFTSFQGFRLFFQLRKSAYSSRGAS